jgi:uncharacterized NAD(P)/FAD-binding protein YdhS
MAAQLRDPAPLPVAIVGGGFSGAITAVQLARALPGRPVLVFERAGPIGAGLAYATKFAGHLLNVRAANMSAFPDDPGHFEAWIAAQVAGLADDCHVTPAGIFTSRRLYARYIRDCFDGVSGRRPQWVRASIVDCARSGDGFVLTDESGQSYPAAAVVLATGHVPAAPNPDPRHVANPWDFDYLNGLDRDRPVLILGSALTMVDILLTLREGGFSGPVTALSRRGVLPTAHRPGSPWPTPGFTPDERRSVRGTLRRLRREVSAAGRQGIDWRAVVDSIRPITAELWMGWDYQERERFLRHARRWWDIHRHRMAPPIEEAVGEELRSGGLTVIAGRTLGIEAGEDGLRVSLRRKGQAGIESHVFQRVITATGLESAKDLRSGLIDRLLARGLVRLDPLGIGIDVAPDLAAIGDGGRPVPGLWALGPIVLGTFWECLAVPDIRRQAAECAASVAAQLG